MKMANDLYDKLTLELRRAREREINYRTAKEELWGIVKSNSDKYLEMFFHNWFNNNWTKPIEELARSQYKPRPKPSTDQTKQRRMRDANLRGIALMNMFLSDGETRLKDATGAQIRQEVGWLTLIAKWVKPNEIVGHKLTAEQLFNLKQQSAPARKNAA